MKRFTAAVTVLLLFSLPAYAAQIGSPAPAFSLNDLKGKTVTLADYRGKVVMVDFWAPWCGPCKEEMPALEALYRKYSRAGLVIVGISVDESEKAISRFLEEVPLSFTVVPDNKGRAAEAYRFSNLPTVYVIGRDGIVRSIHKGFWKELTQVYEKEITELLKQQ